MKVESGHRKAFGALGFEWRLHRAEALQNKIYIAALPDDRGRRFRGNQDALPATELGNRILRGLLHNV